jgi:hypothetical protein
MTNYVKNSFLKFEMKIFIFEIWKTFGHTTIGKWIFLKKNHFEIRTEFVFEIWKQFGHTAVEVKKIEIFRLSHQEKIEMKKIRFWILKWKFSFEIWKKITILLEGNEKKEMKKSYILFMPPRKNYQQYPHTTIPPMYTTLYH